MCGGGGGSNGPSEAQMRAGGEAARQADAIANLNAVFGYGTKKPPVYEAMYMKNKPGKYVTGPNVQQGDSEQPTTLYEPGESYFDEAGYNAAQAEYNASGGDLPELAKRKALYQKFAKDAKDLQINDLTKQKDVASRETGFDLARRGLVGGSRQIDVNRDIDDQFNKGVLQAETNAQGVANQAEASDEKTRISLINGIRSGMDQADASSGALNAMSQSAKDAQNQARQQDVSGFFDEIRAQAQRQQDSQAYQQQFNKYRAGGGSGSYNGTVQNV
jgi:hypothetical protein